MLATLICPSWLAMKDASTTWTADEAFLDVTLTVDRGISVGTLCLVFSELAGGVSSEGMGYTYIFPEAERARMVCFAVEEGDEGVERDTCRTLESRGIERTILPSECVPVGSSQT